MNVTTRELRKFSGHLRQFIADDKGVVIIATFGLRGSTFPNMIAERALPCTIVIHNALQNELAVQNQIGATVGEAYCGVAGGNKRHEYSVMGPSVNLAARLMSSPENPGILVDEAVKIGADQSYGFNALPPVKAKGYAEPVPIFEPLSPLERSWGRVQPNFVGRKPEILRFLNTGRALALSVSPSKFVWVTGGVGMGKSSVVVHALEHIRRIMKTNRRRLIVTKTVAKESDQLVPFGVFSMVLLEVLDYCQQWGDERSLHSFGGSIYSLNTLEWETLSGGSRSRSDSTNVAKTADQLALLCREINTPPEFAELFGRHLFGLDLRIKKKEQGQQRRSSSKTAMLKNLVGFMAKAFLRCVQDADLTVLAFDDVHHLDELSWRVLRSVFETSNKVLIICTSPPITKNLRVPWDPEFWKTLNSKYINDRFDLMNLGPLDEGEILEMIAKTLGIQQRHVSSQLHHNVFSQSKGMPSFAHEILESLKRGKTKTGMVEASETAFESVGELILARLDAFDASVRNVLNIGAVLGSSFELVELVAVLREVLGGDEEEQLHHIRKTREALELAVQEGILFLFHTEKGENEGLLQESSAVSQASPAEDGDEDAEITFGFAFCHEIWRSTILKLMLQERKRDIHRIIAESLRSQLGDNNEDYLSKMKLFSHYKASGDYEAASMVAMSVGTSYEALGMHSQNIRLLQDALAMWKIGNDSVSQEVLDFFTGEELGSVMQLYGAIGKAYSSDGQDRNSVRAYQDALTILGLAPASDDIVDRSVLFPIFYGLFDCFKFGQVEDDEEKYEKTIIRQFLDETRRVGDPIHYCRALAMQVDFVGRIGQFEEATKHVLELRKVYIPREHSAELCLDGGSDMAAIAISRSALYHLSLGESEDTLLVCRYVTSDLMYHMDLSNVHNSFLVIYPVLWAMKSIGLANEARRNFNHFVIDAFRQYYGEGSMTPYLPLHEPILMLLELDEGNVDDLSVYIDWALQEDNLRFGSIVNQNLGMYGKCADAISAEICMILSDHLAQGEEKLQLIQSGLDVALEVTSLTKRKGMISARSDIVVIYKQLMIRAKALVLTVRRGSSGHGNQG
uniref:Guanylate cyclase domain-containing protein n=1 Tax=Grammatophora oceanica TaxID=210454 RepID=A0A7S1YK06_9STRA